MNIVENFGNICFKLNRRGFATGTGNSRENKVDRARMVSADNEAIPDDCVVAFTGGYEKQATEKQPKRVDVDKWYLT